MEVLLSDVSEFTRAQDIDLEMTMFQWFFTIFVEAATTEVTLRLWDQFLLDGNQVLHRFSVALLMQRKHVFLAMDDRADIFTYLKVL